ncbi:MAG: hypothetical protein J6R39_04860, partial [Oscillospiraceae bacterium]|nr:hypothetical protein [Oscillospiraceae bacterium]
AKWAAEGAVKGRWPSILRREGMRQLPEVFWYFAKCMASAVNQGGTADRWYSPLTDKSVLSGAFLFPRERKRRLFSMLLSKRWRP